ncbi:DUF5067 domain-containing protein [Bifidobacterium sp. 82T24]|uniref:DUF5067 domain-containing protein n=1 Tax=Bifidobacterium pluvialisilvae TaxID=2834436 RepID=UPI001C58189B|nr:DUF5067 domain-containing protein [Bifidobacterium pluvialisilvae]MBW3088311.1 DUF5067 domain-containing protein [Bifidobacterium pluvialisilvae]
MGLFGNGKGNDGDHDANGGSDGYVSPFDDQSDYVNINNSSYTSTHDDGNATINANSHGYGNVNINAGKRGNATKRPPSSADAALRGNARYRSNAGGTGTGINANAEGHGGNISTPMQRASAPTAAKRKHPIRIIRNLIIVIVVLYLFTDVFSGIGRLLGIGGGSSRSGTSSSTSSYMPPKTTKPITYKILDRTGNLTYLEQSDKTLSADFTIVSAQRGPKSCNGQNTVLVKYEAKNTSKTDIDMQSYLSFDVYDSGIGLRHIGCFAGGDPDGYDFSDTMRKIAPGSSLGFMQAYELRNNTDTLFDVRIANHARNTPTSIGASFTLPKDSKATDVTKPGSVVKPDMPQGFTLGMTRLTGASYRSDDILGAGRQVDIKAVRAVKGPKTYKGVDTVIVTYQWVNRTPIPLEFTDAVTSTAYQDGVELKPTVFSDPFAGYSVATRDAPVMEDVPMTTTMAYELRNGSQPVTTSVKGYAGLDGKTLKKEFSLE